MHFIWIILIGFIAGLLARFFSPAPNNPHGFILTCLLGIAGAFIATYVGQLIGWYRMDQGAGLIGALPQTASPATVREALRTALLGQDASIDAARFPALVSVTLHGVGRAGCIAAERRARRLEGSVVVELQGYGAPADCGIKNDMTWRFMP